MRTTVLDTCSSCLGKGCGACDGFGVALTELTNLTDLKFTKPKKKRISAVTKAVESNPFDAVRALQKWFQNAANEHDGFDSVCYQDAADHLKKCQGSLNDLDEYENRMGK
jgi:hypothetical protein